MAALTDLIYTGNFFLKWLKRNYFPNYWWEKLIILREKLQYANLKNISQKPQLKSKLIWQRNREFYSLDSEFMKGLYHPCIHSSGVIFFIVSANRCDTSSCNLRNLVLLDT